MTIETKHAMDKNSLDPNAMKQLYAPKARQLWTSH